MPVIFHLFSLSSQITMLCTCPTLWGYLAHAAVTLEKVQRTLLCRHTHTHKRTAFTLSAWTMCAYVSFCTFFWTCARLLQCAQMFVFKFNTCTCVSVGPEEASLMETPFYCASSRQADKQFFWSWALLQLVELEPACQGWHKTSTCDWNIRDTKTHNTEKRTEA